MDMGTRNLIFLLLGLSSASSIHAAGRIIKGPQLDAMKAICQLNGGYFTREPGKAVDNLFLRLEKANSGLQLTKTDSVVDLHKALKLQDRLTLDQNTYPLLQDQIRILSTWKGSSPHSVSSRLAAIIVPKSSMPPLPVVLLGLGIAGFAAKKLHEKFFKDSRDLSKDARK